MPSIPSTIFTINPDVRNPPITIPKVTSVGLSQGNTQSDIAKTLHVGEATISRDISYLRQQAQENLKTHVQDKLPEEYQNCMVGINQVLKICWEIVNKSRNIINNDNSQTVTITDNKDSVASISSYQ
jgi:hypothetical protein